MSDTYIMARCVVMRFTNNSIFIGGHGPTLIKTRVPCAHFKIMAENHFQSSFDHKVRNKLYVKGKLTCTP